MVETEVLILLETIGVPGTLSIIIMVSIYKILQTTNKSWGDLHQLSITSILNLDEAQKKLIHHLEVRLWEVSEELVRTRLLLDQITQERNELLKHIHPTHETQEHKQHETQ